VLAGDLTDLGVEEAEILAQDLKACSILTGVLGNHDYGVAALMR
jgi:hypothetical protein